MLGEWPALQLSSRLGILGYLPAFLWHVHGCVVLFPLGLFYKEKVSLPPPTFLAISLSPDVSEFVGKHVLTAY